METPRIMIILIEYSVKQDRVIVRGCLEKEKYKRLPVLEEGNLQNSIQVFEGTDHGYYVGFRFKND